MAALTATVKIIPGENARKAFRDHGLDTASNWVCFGQSKQPVSAKTLYRSGAAEKWSKSWTTLQSAVERIGATATLSQGKNPDGTYINAPETVLGVGIVLTLKLGLCCIDLDNAVQWHDDQMIIEPDAMEIIQALNTYTEISASGHGLHLFFMGVLPEGHRNKVYLNNAKTKIREVYGDGHFIAITGNLLPGYERIRETSPEEVAAVYERYFRPYEKMGASKPKKINPRKTGKKTGATATGKNIDAIRRRDWKALRKILKPEHTEFSTPGEFEDFIFGYPLDKFLGLPAGEKLPCIFHSEENPSAEIFTSKGGMHLYHCFGCDNTWNIVQAVETLGGHTYQSDAYSFIAKALDTKIIQNRWYLKNKRELQGILDTLSRLDERGFKSLCPNAYGNLRQGLGILQTLLIYVRDNCYSIRFGNEDRIIFGITGERLAALYYEKNKTGDSKTVKKWIRVFKVSEVIRELPDAEIPTELLTKAKNRKTNAKGRHTSFYTIEPWVKHKLDALNDRGIVYKQCKYTAKTLSYLSVVTAEGEAQAKRYFPQSSNDGRKVATVSKAANTALQAKLDEIETAAYTLLQEKGFYTEDLILNQIIFQKGGNITLTEIESYSKNIKRLRKELEDKYNLTGRKCTKELKERFQIESKGYPYIWFLR